MFATPAGECDFKSQNSCEKTGLVHACNSSTREADAVGSVPSLASQSSQSETASEVAQQVKLLATKPDFHSPHPCDLKKAEIGEVSGDKIASN